MRITPKYKSPRGMPDIFLKDMTAIRWIENKARAVFQRFGYSEIQTPILEETEVFTRSIGEGTDIVEKEMYSFTDRSGKGLSLRPEGTASIIRAYIEHGWHNGQDLVKLYYSGPMFRGERPQKGRLRQFHQIGAEIIGGSTPYIDAEIIFNLNILLNSLKINGFTILLNFLGCNHDLIAYKKALAKHLKGKLSGLCDDCKRRVQKNILRVLDCKKEGCKTALKKAPRVTEHLCGVCCENYDSLKALLSDMGVAFREKPDLVRGLDYYTGTIFEAVHPLLGSQNAVAAGGRYDNLAKQMGGPDTGATGYAIGIERLLLLIEKKNIRIDQPGILVIPVNQDFRQEAFQEVKKLWLKGISCEIAHSGRSFKSHMRKAHKDGRRFVLLIGEEEVKNKKLLLKDMETGEQKTMSFEEVVNSVKEYNSI